MKIFSRTRRRNKEALLCMPMPMHLLLVVAVLRLLSIGRTNRWTTTMMNTSYYFNTNNSNVLEQSYKASFSSALDGDETTRLVSYRRHRRVLYVDETLQSLSNSSSVRRPKIRSVYWKEGGTIANSIYHILRNNSSDDDGDSDNATFIPLCQTVREWTDSQQDKQQPASVQVVHPTCNTLYELYSDVPSQLELLNWGFESFAMAVSIQDQSNSTSSSSIATTGMSPPTVAWKGSLDQAAYADDNEEAYMVHEQLSSSPFVMDMHALCGTSMVAPLAKEGTLHDYINQVRRSQGRGGSNSTTSSSQSRLVEFTSLQKLQVAIQLAQGVAALHDTAHFAHNDIDPSQFVFIDGMYQINDFNNGKFLTYSNHPMQFNKKYPGNGTITASNKKECKQNPIMVAMAYRAPEDIVTQFPNWWKNHNNSSSSNATKVVDRSKVLLSKADVFGLGSILYMMLTNRFMFDDELNGGDGSPEDSIKNIVNGKRPTIPEIYAGDPYTAVIVNAIHQCWLHDPNMRPTSRDVAAMLTHRFQTYVLLGTSDSSSGTDNSNEAAATTTSASARSTTSIITKAPKDEWLVENLRITLPDLVEMSLDDDYVSFVY